jgi:hypothetical protein
VCVTNGIGDDDIVQMLIRNLRDIRSVLAYRRALIVVYIEVGSAWPVADRVARLINVPEFQPMFVESRDSTEQRRFGVVTGAEQKRGGTLHLSRELSRNTLTVAADLVSQNKKKAITELANQMRSWRKEIVVPKDQAVGKFSEVFTGKASVGGKKDDRVMALMLALYWSAINHSDPVFVEAMERRGISI